MTVINWALCNICLPAHTACLDAGGPVHIVIGAARAGGTVIPTKTPMLDTKLSTCRKIAVSLTLSVDQHINLRKRVSQSFRFYYRTNIYMLSELILCGIVAQTRFSGTNVTSGIQKCAVALSC